jgi:hypothetical protein
MFSVESSHRSHEAIGNQTILISIVDNAYLVLQSLSANHVCLVAMIMIATAGSRSMHGLVCEEQWRQNFRCDLERREQQGRTLQARFYNHEHVASIDAVVAQRSHSRSDRRAAVFSVSAYWYPPVSPCCTTGFAICRRKSATVR